MKGIKWVLLGLLVSVVWAAGVAAKESGTMAQSVPADLPLIDLAATGFQAVAAPVGRQPVSAVPPAITKTAVSTAAPGQEVVYTG